MAQRRRQDYLEDHHLLDFSGSKALFKAFQDELEPVREDATAELRCSIKESQPQKDQKPDLIDSNAPSFLTDKRNQRDTLISRLFQERNSIIQPSGKTSSKNPLNKTVKDVKELKIKSKDLKKIANNYSVLRPKLHSQGSKQVYFDDSLGIFITQDRVCLDDRWRGPLQAKKS